MLVNEIGARGTFKSILHLSGEEINWLVEKLVNEHPDVAEDVSTRINHHLMDKELKNDSQ